MSEYFVTVLEWIIKWITPISIIAVSIIAGWLFEKAVIKRVAGMIPASGWEPGTVVIGALRRMTIFWFLLAGSYLAAVKLSPEVEMLASIRTLVAVLAIFTVTIVASRIFVGIIDAYAKKSEGVLPSTSIFSNIARVVIFIVGILIILQYLGLSIAPMLTALGVGGLAVALALKDTLSNLFAGIQIIVSRQIRQGDYIELDAERRGYVVDISWRNTMVRGLGNNHIIIPNSVLSDAVIVNYHLHQAELSVLVPVGVAYDSDLELVERVTLEVAGEIQRGIPGAVAEYEPIVRFTGFNDSAIGFNVILRAREYVEQFILRHEFIKRLQRRYEAEGIEIPFPIRTVYMKESLKNK
ncbi:MAG: mechanosensitive ion channel family protein [Spirochaetes bacterium]|jgi:small-conductance mechanosensitive channel|nr:mechanosensitive ion channel family protein [Spirochaetota bacterium]